MIAKIYSLSARTILFTGIVLGVFLLHSTVTLAATISMSPSTGVYQSGTTFTVNVQVNTQSQPINAADATIKFNPKELSVVSVNRTSSIFNLWVTEPTFSNTAGTISFSGGLPSGYTGANGRIMAVTFRAVGSGPVKTNFSSGSVLANDGKGTNVLTSMNGGSYTIQAASAAPEPEVIEYVAPANTPSAPNVTSATHGDVSKWSTKKTAELRWDLPSGVTGVRTLLDTNPTTVPTKVYDSPISSITLEDLPEGVSFFHIQFRNADGWGKVTHYRLAIDSEKPSRFEISQPDEIDAANPIQTLLLTVEDSTSDVRTFKVKIDSDEPYDYYDETGSSTLVLPTLPPGYHTIIIEAFDEAGNSIISTYSFTIEAFDRPIFTEYPTEINEDVIPVIKGMTRAGSEVIVSLTKVGSETLTYSVIANDTGEFIFIPEGTFTMGVYELSAVATDVYGAQSNVSELIRIAVQQPGFVRIGSFIINILSVVIPLVALVVISIFGTWYMFAYLRRFRRKVGVESTEALDILHREFASLQTKLREQESDLQNSRKTKKLTQAESDMIEVFDKALQASQRAVEKEIKDVQNLTSKK